MYYRVVSFDVGIKNLAYCVIDISSSGILDIVDWRVINLLYDDSNTNVTKKCSAQILKKKVYHYCGKDAKYIDPINENNTVCQRHAKCNQRLIMPQACFSESFLKKQTVAKITDIISKTTFLIVNKKRNKNELINDFCAYIKQNMWISIDKSHGNPSADKANLIEIGRKIHNVFSIIDTVKFATHVVIENQISPIASRMKTIQGMITQEFIMLNSQNIEYVSSSNKLKNYVNNSKNSSYKDHKKNGILFCKEILEERFNKKWLDFFEGTKNKKDDLADSFLQGIWFIENKIMLNATNIKINNVSSP